MQTSRFRLALTTLVLLALAGLIGCTQLGATSSGESPEVGRAGDGAAPQATSAPTESGPTEAGRSIVRTGALSLRGDDLTGLAERLRQLAERLGGFVASEQIRSGDDTRSASARIEFSVPAESMDAFMTEAATYAELVTRTVTATDVTDAVVDVEARIRTLRESIERIRTLMERAGSIADIARVESELTERQSELEALLARQKALADAVDRAPVTVTLVRPGQGTDPDNPLLVGLQRAWQALQQSITLLLTLVGGLLPFALVLGLIAWPVLRHLRRKTSAPTPPAQTKPDHED